MADKTINDLDPAASVLPGDTLELGSGQRATAGQLAAVRAVANALAIASGAVAIDCALGDFFTLELTANVTSITFANAPAAGAIAVRFKQDAIGGRTIALPASLHGINGTDVQVGAAASSYTLLHLQTFDAGTRWEYTMRGVL